MNNITQLETENIDQEALIASAIQGIQQESTGSLSITTDSDLLSRMKQIAINSNGVRYRIGFSERGIPRGFIIDQPYIIEINPIIFEEIILALDIDPNDKTKVRQTLDLLNKKVRRNIRASIYEAYGICLRADEGSFTQGLNQAKRALGEENIFREEIATCKFSDSYLRELFREVILSGSFTSFIPYITDENGRISFDAFERRLALADSPLEMVSLISQRVDFLNEEKFPEYNISETEPPQKETRRKQRFTVPPLSRRVSSSAEVVLEGNVLSIAREMGVDISTLRAATPESFPQGKVSYGTTDFANPAEAIMTSAVAGKINRESIYYTDLEAHTVGSYLTRILNPSLSSFYRLTEVEQSELQELAAILAEAKDISLEDLENIPQGKVVFKYFLGLKEKLGLQSETFSEIYREMNERLARTLGIRYSTAAEVLEGSSLTIGQLRSFINDLAPRINQNIQKVIGIFIARYGEATARGKIKTFFGNSVDWRERKFLRRVDEVSTEGDILESLDKNLNLSELAKLGFTLGGNGWVTLTQYISEKQEDEGLIIAHKITTQGSNYALPLSVAEKTRCIVSPIIRVVPKSGDSQKGDGLDIGMYFYNPKLINLIQELYITDDPEVVGGIKKIVVTVDYRTVYTSKGLKTVPVVETFKSSAKQGSLERFKETIYLNFEE